MKVKNIIRLALITAFILLLPLLVMQFTDEMDWDLVDFAVAGALLFGAGLTYELIAGKIGNITYRIAIGLAVVTALILIWVNLAVGIIGTEDNPVNLMYVGVLAVGIIGSLSAGFRPYGMALAMFATAFAQILVGVIALIAELGPSLTIDLLFSLLWVGAALLFLHARNTESK